MGSNTLDHEGEQHDEEMDSDSELEPDYRVKTETLDRFMPDAEGTPVDVTPPKPVASTKQSIMSIIDRTPEIEREREALAALPDQGPSPDSAVPSKRKFEYEPPAEKENADPIERVE